MKIEDEIIKKAQQMARELQNGHDVVIKIGKDGLMKVQALSIKKIN